MNKIGQLSKFCLRKRPHVRASLYSPSETGLWLCQAPSASPVLGSLSVRRIHVEDLPQKETPVIGIHFNFSSKKLTECKLILNKVKVLACHTQARQGQ